MSEEPSINQTVTAPPIPAVTSAADIAALIQQLQTPPIVTSQPQMPTGLESLLGAAQLQSQFGGLNPLTMLTLGNTLGQSNPLSVARLLLMNMNMTNMTNMLAAQPPSDIISSLTQQENLMSVLARASSLSFPPQPTQSVQQPSFAVPQVLPHMSLKRGAPAVNQADRKKSCPPAMAAIQNQVQQPPPARSPTPPLKKMLANLTPEQKKNNEVFRAEILRRLDVILLEEFGTEDEEEEDIKNVKLISSEEDDDDIDKKDEMGSTGSAFRRILSRSSTMGNNSSESVSGTASPSTGSLSSGPSSPPIEMEPLTPDFNDMITSVATMRVTTRDVVVSDLVDEAHFTEIYPPIWTGCLAIKSIDVLLRLHYVAGNKSYIGSVLGNFDDGLQRDRIKINQRMRLNDASAKSHLHKIFSETDFACCIGSPSETTEEAFRKMEEKMDTNIIQYLNQKAIAGISTLENIGQLKNGRVHIFAPSQITRTYLQIISPELAEYLVNNKNEKYVLVIFTPDRTEVRKTVE